MNKLISRQPGLLLLRQKDYNKMIHSEEAIIEGCLKHKRKAQKLLYDKYFSLMMGICLRYSSSKTDAEDILLRGFYNIFSKIHQFENRGSFTGWMQRVMVNTAIDQYRKNKSRQENEAALFEDMDATQLSDEKVPDNYTLEMILETLKKLPEGYRMVFNLYAIEGYSHKEIAEKLGVSINTSKTQLLKARKFLQRLLLELDENINTG